MKILIMIGILFVLIFISITLILLIFITNAPTQDEISAVENRLMNFSCEELTNAVFYCPVGDKLYFTGGHFCNCWDCHPVDKDYMMNIARAKGCFN